jgi:hypothetical protein
MSAGSADVTMPSRVAVVNYSPGTKERARTNKFLFVSHTMNAFVVLARKQNCAESFGVVGEVSENQKSC